MQKMSRGLLCMFMAAAMFLSLLNTVFFGFCKVFAATETEISRTDEDKIVDIYLIGGQSNAAGYSHNFAKICPDVEDVTFKNVDYAGQINKKLSTGRAEQTILTYPFRVGVERGLGHYDRTVQQAGGYVIGPEYGIAEVINEKYEKRHNALIFKTAAGGTALHAATADGNDDWGNWYPRSLWTDEMPKDGEPHGHLYNLFVENFRTVCKELTANGLIPNVQGMAWMQGESDLIFPAVEYESLLKTFICDIRNDIAGITGNESDKNMPFIIGEIATTYIEYNYEPVPAFNEVQRKVAKDTENCYTVPTADLIINGEDGLKGADGAHFNVQDARTLGMRFGEALFAHADIEDIELTATDGKIETSYNGTQLVLDLVPNDGYRLKRLIVNDMDVTEQVENNRYIIYSPNRGLDVAVAEFELITEFQISYEVPDGQGVVEGAKIVARGETLTVKVTANKGYKIKSVTFNDVEMDYDNESGQYVANNLLQNGTVRVEFEPTEAAISGGIIAIIVVVCVIAVGCIVTAIVVIKRKKNKQ